MSLRSAHREIRARAARRASHQLPSHAGWTVERYSLLSASVDRSRVSLVGAILNALHYEELLGKPCGFWVRGAHDSLSLVWELRGPSTYP
jgi:hypothetical protein